MMSGNNLKLPDGLSNKIIADILKPDFGEVQIKNIEATSGSTDGDNYLSKVSRITVNFITEHEEKTKSFIVKDAKEAVSDFAKKVDIIEKEMSWYGDILPEIEKFQIDLGSKCYFKHNNWLLLEDLSVLDYKVLDRKAMLDLDHCIKAVEALAKFHAVTHHLHKINKLTNIIKKDTIFTIENKTLLYENFKQFDNIAQTLMEMGDTKYYESIKNLKSSAWEKMQQCIDENKEFLSLVHGDYWTTNILFNYDQQGKVLNAKIIDFQLTRLLTPAFDLHFFICSSIKPTVRDNNLNEIYKKYLETLNLTLKSLNSETTLSQEKFDKMMKNTIFIGLFISLTFLPVPLCEKPLQFNPPDDMSEDDKKDYRPFDVVYQQNTYKQYLLSVLEFYRKHEVI